MSRKYIIRINCGPRFIRLFRAVIIFLACCSAAWLVILPDLIRMETENYMRRMILSVAELLPSPLLQLPQGEAPLLPLSYWEKNKDNFKKYYKRKDCARFPSMFDVEYHNIYWQTLSSKNGTFYLYGAYLDKRGGPGSECVRILGVYDRIEPTLVTHCQIWFEEKDEPAVVRNLEYKYIWRRKWGNHLNGYFHPYLFSCALPASKRHLTPAAVSFVEKPCDNATNILRIHQSTFPLAGKKEFAVCVKGLDFLHIDFSVRLVEWIELLLLLGTDKIFFYDLHMHPNMHKVLEYYQRNGKALVTPITLPGGQPNVPPLQHIYLKEKIAYKRQMELIPYNDCLYRHMHQYRWLVLLDVDEVIVPIVDDDWSALMRRVVPLATKNKSIPPFSSYHVSNMYFLDSVQKDEEKDLPVYAHMLRNVWRTSNFTKSGLYVKSFHETERVITVHNHFPLSCRKKCSPYHINSSIARLHHYRSDCESSLKQSCVEIRAHPVKDTLLWRWKKPLLERMKRVLNELNLISS